MFPYRMTGGMLLVFLSLAGTVLGGENPMLEEIVVKGETESPIQESLTMKEVRESPAQDLGEALQQLEGVSIVRKGAIANDIVLRGFQKDNINVLVDGVRLHGACPNRMDPPAFHYDFAEVEQVGIVKGPYDLENPGGLGGTVNVVTKEPGKGFGSDLSLTYGSYNRVNGSVTASYGGDSLDGLLGYAYKFSRVPRGGGGRRITEIYPANSPNRYRSENFDTTAYEINTGWAKFGYRPTADSRTELSYTYQDADQVIYPYLKMDAVYDRAQRLNWSYRAEKLTPVVRELKLQAYWDRVDHLMNDVLRVSSLPSARVTRDYSMQTDAKSWVAGAKAGFVLAVGPGSWKSGIDYYQRNWQALNVRAMYTMTTPYTTLNMIPDVAVDNLGLYSGYELPLAKDWTVRGGVRGDLTWIDANLSNNATAVAANTDFGEVSANLQLAWKPNSGLEIFAGVARGTRTPDPEELYIDVPATPPAVTWRGNPDLKATINYQADLGAKLSGDGYYLSASVFYSSLDDYVNLEAVSPTLKSYRNIDASIWGGELGSQVSLPFDLFLRGSLSYTEGRNLDGDRPLAEMPPLRGMVSVRYDTGTYFLELAENMALRQDRVDSNLNEQETAGWATTDLKAGVAWHNWSVYGGINNIFDQLYYNHLSYQRDPFASGVGVKVPENGRNLYLTVAYKF